MTKIAHRRVRESLRLKDAPDEEDLEDAQNVVLDLAERIRAKLA